MEQHFVPMSVLQKNKQHNGFDTFLQHPQVWTRLAETANKHDTVIVLQAGA